MRLLVIKRENGLHCAINLAVISSIVECEEGCVIYETGAADEYWVTTEKFESIMKRIWRTSLDSGVVFL